MKVSKGDRHAFLLKYISLNDAFMFHATERGRRYMLSLHHDTLADISVGPTYLFHDGILCMPQAGACLDGMSCMADIFFASFHDDICRCGLPFVYNMKVS